jgi:hypothetical protein
LIIDEEQTVISGEGVGVAEPLIPLSGRIGHPDIVNPEGVPPLVLDEDAMRGLLLENDRCRSRRDRSDNTPGQDEESCDDEDENSRFRMFTP